MDQVSRFLGFSITKIQVEVGVLMPLFGVGSGWGSRKVGFLPRILGFRVLITSLDFLQETCRNDIHKTLYNISTENLQTNFWALSLKRLRVFCGFLAGFQGNPKSITK